METPIYIIYMYMCTCLPFSDVRVKETHLDTKIREDGKKKSIATSNQTFNEYFLSNANIHYSLSKMCPYL